MSAAEQQAVEPSPAPVAAAEPQAAAPAAEAKPKRPFTWTPARKEAFVKCQAARAERIQVAQQAGAAPKTPAAAAADPVAALILGPDAQSTKPSAKSSPAPATPSSNAPSTSDSTTPASSATTPPAAAAAPPAAPLEPDSKLSRSEELPKDVGEQKVTLTYRELMALAREGLVPKQAEGEPKRAKRAPARRRPTRRHADDDLLDSSTEEEESAAEASESEYEEAPPRRRPRVKSASGKEALGRAPPKPLGIAASLRGYGAGAGPEPSLFFLS